MSGTQSEQTPAAVHDLLEAGKVVADATGAVAGERLRAEVDVRSSRAAVELKAFAVATRESIRSLREQGHDVQADLMDGVAGRADRLAARLATSDTDALMEDGKELGRSVVAFARKEPMLVIAGGFTLGLLLPKLLEAVTDES